MKEADKLIMPFGVKEINWPHREYRHNKDVWDSKMSTQFTQNKLERLYLHANIKEVYMSKTFAGQGGKRPQLNLSIDKLHPDPENPRLPEDYQGKSEKEVLYALRKYFDLEEIAYSMAKNGYFDEEPIVVIPKNLPSKFSQFTSTQLKENTEYLEFISSNETEFIVAEGNRRLSTAKILISKELRVEFKVRTWPTPSEEIIADLSLIPSIVYPNKQEVLPYLGVRHISGIKKWEPYAKARYIAKMVNEGLTIDQVQEKVGERGTSTRKIYFCYKLVEQIQQEYEHIDVDRAKDYFSYLLLALGQGAIKRFLGITKNWIDVSFDPPVRGEKIENLRLLFSWLFGEGKDTRPVVLESRDITNYLSYVLKNEKATQHLIANRNLNDAWERSDGEKELLLKQLNKANTALEKALGLVYRYKNEETVEDQLKQLSNSLEAGFKMIQSDD